MRMLTGDLACQPNIEYWRRYNPSSVQYQERGKKPPIQLSFCDMQCCPWNPDTYLNVFLISRHWVWLHGAPVSSISRLSLLNYGATSIQKVLYRTVEASLPSSVTIYLLCEALIKISFRLKKNVVCDIFSYIENVNLIQSICQVSMKMM